jgi:hypothetical protein
MLGELLLRPTVIAGETASDDYQVFWNGLSIGRILESSPASPWAGRTGIGEWRSGQASANQPPRPLQ